MGYRCQGWLGRGTSRGDGLDMLGYTPVATVAKPAHWQITRRLPFHDVKAHSAQLTLVKRLAQDTRYVVVVERMRL